MKRILLPTDFSDNSWDAHKYALELFREDECTFYVLHAFRVPVYTTENLMSPEPGFPDYDEALDKSEKQVQKIMQGLRLEKNEKHHFEGISRYNSPLGAIEAFIEKNPIDLIVMGTKGAKRFGGPGYGSNAVAAMETILKCPVLAIPEEAEFKPLKEIVFPVTYAIDFQKSELEFLIELVKKFKAGLRILHITEEDVLSEAQLKNKRELGEIFRSIDFSYHTLSNIHAVAGINCFAESREAEMIAFLSEKHNFLQRLLENIVVKGVSYYSKTPFLVMHTKQ